MLRTNNKKIITANNILHIDSLRFKSQQYGKIRKYPSICIQANAIYTLLIWNLSPLKNSPLFSQILRVSIYKLLQYELLEDGLNILYQTINISKIRCLSKCLCCRETISVADGFYWQGDSSPFPYPLYSRDSFRFWFLAVTGNIVVNNLLKWKDLFVFYISFMSEKGIYVFEIIWIFFMSKFLWLFKINTYVMVFKKME